MKRVATLLFLLAGVAIGLWQVSKARSFQFFGEIVPRVATTDSVVALTFDDGPAARYTDDVLAILRDRAVTATFFVTGREAEANVDAARRVVDAGHALGNHSYSHPSLVFRGLPEIREEVERTDAAIRAAGYEGEVYFRPPYGKKLFLLPWHLARTGRTTVTWDVEPESYPDVARDAHRITEHVVERVRPGSIVLLHVMYDSRAESRKALPWIIDRLRERGYTFVTVSELLRSRGA